MRKWGIVISLFYAAIVFGLLIPAGIILAGGTRPLSQVFSSDMPSMLKEWLSWIPIAAIIAGEVVLLFLSVDTSFRKLKPRTHIAVSVVVGSMLFALLFFAGLSALSAVVYADKFIDLFW